MTKVSFLNGFNQRKQRLKLKANQENMAMNRINRDISSISEAPAPIDIVVENQNDNATSIHIDDDSLPRSLDVSEEVEFINSVATGNVIHRVFLKCPENGLDLNRNFRVINSRTSYLLPS